MSGMTRPGAPACDHAIMLLAEFGSGEVFWSLVWLFLFVVWAWLVIAIFLDLFRAPDLSGWGKALWAIVIVALPYLGVFAYIVLRGHKMEINRKAARSSAEFGFARDYLPTATGRTTASPDIGQLAALQDQRMISQDTMLQARGQPDA